MNHAKQGAEVLSSDPAAAVIAYTKALIEHPTSPDYYTQRSIAFTRVKPPYHALALADAETAVLCGSKRGNREKIQAGQQRRVVALYNLGRYADAKFILDSMLKDRKDSKPQQMEHAMWNTKITGKLTADSSVATVTEIPSHTLPNDTALIKSLKSQLKSDGTYNYSGEDTSVEPTATISSHSTSLPTTEITNQPGTAVASTPVALQNVRHEWYQNNQNIIVTIYAKGVPKDKAEVELLEDCISISFPHPSDHSRSFTFTLDPLFAFIDPSVSKYSVMSTKIELTLAKAVQGQKWANLEGTEPLVKHNNDMSHPQGTDIRAALQQSIAAEKGPSYPTSSKSGPKNWDKVAQDLTAKHKKAKNKSEETEQSKSDDDSDDGYESDYGGDAVDGFFKKLYAGADPDTRRAMMKSFQESNGTALSTNWTDVGARKVEVVQSKNDD